MILNKIKGQKRATKQLESIYKTGKVSHAYLFSGPSGAGKHYTARLFSALLNCETNGCGTCLTCNQISNGLPPLHLVEPIGKEITIDQIRQSQKIFQMKSEKKITPTLIIDDIDKMNQIASNAILKLLEEPPGRACIIGVTSSPEDLLPTIKSRFIEIRFSPLSREAVTEILLQKNYDKDKIDFALRIFSGDLSASIDWLEDIESNNWRKHIIQDVIKMIQGKNLNPQDIVNTVFSPLKNREKDLAERQKKEMADIENFYKNKKDASSIIKNIESIAKKRKNKLKSQFLSEMLFVITSFYRDIVYYICDKGQNGIINTDFEQEIAGIAKRKNTNEIITAMSKVRDIRSLMSYNLEEKFMAENLLFQLREVHR